MSTTEDKFVIALSKLEDGEHTLLEVGEHTLTYSAVDEAGNKLTDEKVTFEVKAARSLQDRDPARLEPDIVPGDTGGHGHR